MIPAAYIREWRDTQAPWPSDAQVEQDLILSRAVVEIYLDPLIKEHLAFRGGTALHKLILHPPARYSEDIDLVQVKSDPIGSTMAALRSRLDSWLGKPTWKQSEGRVTMAYRLQSEISPVVPLRVKVEVNTREHFSVLNFTSRTFHVESRWFQGSAEVLTYETEELLGTKLRALYQRRKGRDLFDLALALERFPTLDRERTVNCFLHYMEQEGKRISRAEFESNMAAKMEDEIFHGDIGPLLATSASSLSAPYDPDAAYTRVHEGLIVRLPGEPWKGDNKKTR